MANNELSQVNRWVQQVESGIVNPFGGMDGEMLANAVILAEKHNMIQPLDTLLSRSVQRMPTNHISGFVQRITIAIINGEIPNSTQAQRGAHKFLAQLARRDLKTVNTLIDSWKMNITDADNSALLDSAVRNNIKHLLMEPLRLAIIDPSNITNLLSIAQQTPGVLSDVMHATTAPNGGETLMTGISNAIQRKSSMMGMAMLSWRMDREGLSDNAKQTLHTAIKKGLQRLATAKMNPFQKLWAKISSSYMDKKIQQAWHAQFPHDPLLKFNPYENMRERADAMSESDLHDTQQDASIESKTETVLTTNNGPIAATEASPSINAEADGVTNAVVDDAATSTLGNG